MPRRAIIRTILATMIGLVLWAPASAASAANPCCHASVSGVPSQLTAGAQPQFFSTMMSYTAPAQQQFRSLTAVFTFSGQSLSSGQIQLARIRGGGWHSISVSRRNGVLTGIDTFDLGSDQRAGGSITSQYRISFGSRTQSQDVQMRFTMAGRLNDGRHTVDMPQLDQAGPFRMTVTGAAAATSTKAPAPVVQPTPTPTEAPSGVQSSDGSPIVGAAPGDTLGTDAANASGGSGLWIAYMVGALLLIGGIGLIGTILWKRGGRGAEGGDWEDPYAPTFGPPSYAQPGYTAPTTAYGSPAPAYGPPAPSFPPAPTTYGPAPTTAIPPQAPPTQAYGSHRPPLDPTQHMPRQ